MSLACHACGKTHPGAKYVELHDGRRVSNYSKEWFAECEARAVLNMATKKERLDFLEGVERARGIDARITLSLDIVTLQPKEMQTRVLGALLMRMKYEHQLMLRAAFSRREREAESRDVTSAVR